MFESTNYTDTFRFISKSSGIKEVTEFITIDDGTGKLFTYSISKKIIFLEYSINPDFNIIPKNPTIKENAKISNITKEKYNSSLFDFGINGISENKENNIILTEPISQKVKLKVNYFTGWENKEKSIIKSVIKTNIAPIVCNEMKENQVFSKKQIFTSCSVDPENFKLKIDWKLYFYINNNWNLIETLNNSEIFEYIYIKEGKYKIIEFATDISGETNSLIRIFNITFNENIELSNIKYKGEIELKPGKYEMIAIPLENMFWNNITHSFEKDINIKSNIYNCVVLQLEDRYNKPAKELFKLASAKDIISYNYIPGFTKENSKHNFNLVSNKNNNIKEIVTFWIKSISDFTFTIKWEIK